MRDGTARRFSLNPIALDLAHQFPLLWSKAVQADLDERSERQPESLGIEAAEALHQLWIARQPGSSWRRKPKPDEGQIHA